MKSFILLLLLLACGHEQPAQPTSAKTAVQALKWGAEGLAALRNIPAARAFVEEFPEADAFIKRLPATRQAQALSYFGKHAYPREAIDFVQSHPKPEQALEFLQSLRATLAKTRGRVDRGRKRPASDLEVLHALPQASVIGFLRGHPLAETRGIFANMLADELGVNAISWGKYLNKDRSLKTLQFSKKPRIFLDGVADPREQVARVLEKYIDVRGEPLHSQGVSLAEVAEDDSLRFRQLGWNERALHHSIGQLLDQEKYVTELVGVDGSIQKLIFAKGHTPREQVARALASFAAKDFERGVPLAEIAAKLSFRQDSRDGRSLHHSIGQLLDQEKYVTELVGVDGSNQTLIFAKGHMPREQVARALAAFKTKDFMRGVPLAEIATKVNFRQDGWDEHALHVSIGQLLDQEKYVTEVVGVDGSIQKLIFAKGHTPREQVACALASFEAKDFMHGVSFAKIADKVGFRQDSWNEHALYNSISKLLDREKYVTRVSKGQSFVYLR